MIIGVFSPLINWCGGAEWVAINIINALKKAGHQIVVLTDRPINQEKILETFDKKLYFDQQFVLPLNLFPPIDYRNIYTDIMRSMLLKLKCNILIDTYSGAMLPGMNVSYIHYPIFKLLQTRFSLLKNRLYYYPYKAFLDFSKRNICDKLILANSEFTAKAIKDVIGVNSYVLYPPLSSRMLNYTETELSKKRENTVITVGRISHGKNLTLIPQVARETRDDISFVIVGLLDSVDVFKSISTLSKKLGVSERVKILLNLSRKSLEQLLLNFKVYLHPKVNEHFGVSIVEAMASGCIPIVHDSGGPREFVPENLRYKSIEEAAEKVENAIDNWSPKRAEYLSRNVERFSERIFSEKFLKIFNSQLIESL